MTDAEPEIAQPWLRLEYENRWGFLNPEEAVRLRDYLVQQGSEPAKRLAELIGSTLDILLASPLHAGTRRIRVAKDEHPVLMEGLLLLEDSVPPDRFWKLREALAPKGCSRRSR